MRMSSARFTSSALGLGLAAIASYVAFSAGGCTVTTSDGPLDGGDSAITDTGGTDTTPPKDTNPGDVTTDTGGGPAVIVPAAFLVGGLCDGVACDIRDFGGGSTKRDIIPADPTEGMIIYDAYAVAGGKTSTEIKGTQSAGYVDGKIYGLPAGAPVDIIVTGYLRGMMGTGPSKGTDQIAWAAAKCTATPSATNDVKATCVRQKTGGTSVACTNGCLTLIPTLKGILFTSDVLPTGYCTGKGATDFDLYRARLPFSGAVSVSRNEQDCAGMIWIPSDGTWSEESPGISNWGLSTEIKSSGTACSLSNPCKVDRNKTPGACNTAGSANCLDVYVVGSECQMTNTSTGGSCF